MKRLLNKKIKYIAGDVRDTKKLINVIKTNQIKSVIHFAALKSVEDSVTNPLDYYDVNVMGTISLSTKRYESKWD